jgi:hypothetical protein
MDERYSKEEIYKMFLEWRGIDPDFGMVCSSCSGSGVKSYGSTSTWRGGIGGQMITTDVCDKCWGSGNAHCAWPSHRLITQHLPRNPQKPDDTGANMA